MLPVCDTHLHIFDPSRFPYAASRAYTPPPASLTQLKALHQALGIERCVIVQPTVYRNDNACLLDAIAQLGQEKARGVAVVDLLAVSDTELERLHAGGVRGLRLNLHANGAAQASAIAQLRAAKRLLDLPNWHLQVFAPLALNIALLKEFEALALPIVLDHFGGATDSASVCTKLLPELFAALKQMPLFIKLSAQYRIAQGLDISQLAQTFYETAPAQMLWGSDWPHTGGAASQSSYDIQAFRTVDNAAALALLKNSLGEAAMAQILRENPDSLYFSL